LRILRIFALERQPKHEYDSAVKPTQNGLDLCYRMREAWSALRIRYSLILLICIQIPLGAQPLSWSHYSLSGSGPNLNAAPPVYDANSNRLIVFGGQSIGCCGGPVSDTWVLTNANGVGGTPTWTQLTPSGSIPAARLSHSAVYDQANNRMIIFAGGVGGCGVFCTLFSDVWVLSSANGLGGTPTWTQINPSAPNGFPAPRAAHRAVYDPATNRMIIFGGGNNGTADMNDTWILTNANGLGGTPTWTQLIPSGSLPAGREAFVSTYDQVTNTMTVFGGCCTWLGDLWILSNANGLGGTPAWTQVTQTSPMPGLLANWNYGYDHTTNTLLFFGGFVGSAYQNGVWELNNANGIGTPTWVNPIPNGTTESSPQPGSPVGTFDPVEEQLIVAPDAADLWVLPVRGTPFICNVHSTTLDTRAADHVVSAAAQGSGCSWNLTVNSLESSLWLDITNTIIGPASAVPADAVSNLYAQSGVIAPGKSIVYKVQFSGPNQSLTAFADLKIGLHPAMILNIVQAIIDGVSIAVPLGRVGTAELAIEDVAQVLEVINQMPHFENAIADLLHKDCLGSFCINAPNVVAAYSELTAFAQSSTEPGLFLGLLRQLGVDISQAIFTALTEFPGALASIILEIEGNVETAFFGSAGGGVTLTAH